ncbi:MAG: hypothetical protein ACLFSQ_08860 [Candidatus Zixiibacteriota bacterium]
MQKLEAQDYSQEITSWDIETYKSLISDKLKPEDIDLLVNPDKIFPRQKQVLAVHWHPEIVPLEIVRKRIENMFPNKEEELIIPTQHNQLLTYDGFTGVEVDCYSPEFERKVQLLMHFKKEKLENGDVFRSMLEHTFKYRSSQFHEFLETLINPKFKYRIEEAAIDTGADEGLVDFAIIHAKKHKMMFEQFYSETPPTAIRNKLLTNYFVLLEDIYEEHFVHHLVSFIKRVKKIVKRDFKLDYFYETKEIIEEARSLGGCIVVPHPEQFWPILLADYDVDGYEVWNPQSRQYTEFLINVVNKKNSDNKGSQKPILVFMGDDTHLGAKLLPPKYQKREKANREIGFQPAWDDMHIRKSLIRGNFSRKRVIIEYKERLEE